MSVRPYNRPTRRWTRLAASLTLAVTLSVVAACASPAAPRANKPAPSGASATPAVTAKPPAKVGPAAPETILSISLVLRGQSPDDFAAALKAIDDPASASYHHYLSAEQIAARFGATPADVARVTAALASDGMTAGTLASDRLLLGAQGTVARLDAFFSVEIDAYRDAEGTITYAPSVAPKLPAAFGGAVGGVLGLDTRPALHTGARLTPARPALSGEAGLTPTDLEGAYDLGPLYSGGLDGSGQTIALAEIDSFRQSDVQSYDQTFNISASQPQVIKVGKGPKGTSPEPVLDIEIVNAIAPKATVLVYESAEDLGSVATMLSRIVSDHRAQVLSVSLGTCEVGLDPSTASSFISTLNDTFQRANAEGMSVLVASGDNGAYDCADSNLSVGAVAANPYVTAVGGTALFLNGSSGYGHEAGWEGPLEGAGSGGGVSTIYSRPSWQTGPGVSNSYSNGMRQAPDVAAAADPLTGYAIYYTDQGCSGNSCFTIVGGTSAATPLWAGLILLANQQASKQSKGPLGFLDPALYALGATNGGVYHDVTIGGNLYYNAGANWDYTTGWGSPDGALLVPALLTASGA
jgi:subtilase family serine protease